MSNTNKKNYSIVDESRSQWMTILILAWPIFLEQVLTSLVQAVDTAMVGSMGAVATTSVSISQSPNMLVNGVVMALGVGFTSMIARSVGAWGDGTCKNTGSSGNYDGLRTWYSAFCCLFCHGQTNSGLDGRRAGDFGFCRALQ